MRYLLALLLAGCACIPPDGTDIRAALDHRHAAVMVELAAQGHDLDPGPWRDVVVTTREGVFTCGGVHTDGCAHVAQWPGCDHIEIARAALGTAAVEHEILHFVLDANGIPSRAHAGDFPDFYRVVYRAHKRTVP